ncbi:MAG: DUF177 domain-containing protein [Candidatus Omnitrophota bacterium]|jgi:uncharacterized protein
MRITLADLTEGIEVEVREELDPKALDIEFVDLCYPGRVCLDAKVEKGPDTLSVRGVLSGAVEQICGRCLKRIAGTFEKPFDLYYETGGKDVIDATDDLREVLMLDHPVPFLCREDCRGLCPQCGVDLNEARCRCRPDERSGSKTSLKELLEKKIEGRKHAES